MPDKIKRILTIDDLYNFYFKENKNCTFSAKESGYQVSVQIPAQFEINQEYSDDSLLFCKVKLMHSGTNRNHSNVTDEALVKAGKTLAYKPILANFMEYEDSDTGEILHDFTSHDAEFNDDGTITYLEKQIGCFTSDEAYTEIEEETGHNFLYGFCAIPRTYTDAADIIERKNGTKVSVELSVNEMQYNAKDKRLDLTDVIIEGATCLGKNPETKNDVEEGMKNARLDIVDFSTENNSVISNTNVKMVETLDKLNELLSNVLDKNYRKEDFEKHMDNEKKNVEETVENTEETFENETKEFSEETPAVEEDSACNDDDKDKFNDDSDDDSDDDDDYAEDPDNDDDKNPDDNKDDDEITDVDDDEPENDNDENKEKNDDENYSKTFELSHEDIRCALYSLLVPYEELDNDWYYIVTVFDDRFIYQGCAGNFYEQKYKTENDSVVFDGERYEVYAEFVTASEKAELESMRANYSSISEKLAKYEKEEEIADKMSVFNEGAYAEYLDKEEFKELMKEENLLKYSKDELAEKADAVYGKLNRTTHVFEAKKENTIPSPFVGFSHREENSEFLDGLLKRNK